MRARTNRHKEWVRTFSIMTVCLALFSVGWSHVSPEHKALLDEGKVYRCTQLNCNNACVTWDFRDKEDHSVHTIRKCGEKKNDQEDAYGMENGIFKIPVVYYQENVASTTHQWELVDSVWMTTPEAESNTNLGTDISDAPKLSYRLKVDNPGEYYLWIKGAGPDANADSVNYGIDGERTGTITFLDRDWSNHTQYTNTKATVILPSGVHTLDIWMREDSTRIMLIEVAQDAEHIPSDGDYTP